MLTSSSKLVVTLEIIVENMMEIPTMNKLKNRVMMPPTVVPRLRRELMRLSLTK